MTDDWGSDGKSRSHCLTVFAFKEICCPESDLNLIRVITTGGDTLRDLVVELELCIPLCELYDFPRKVDFYGLRRIVRLICWHHSDLYGVSDLEVAYAFFSQELLSFDSLG